jgi:arylsulfatase A-like enzyme
MRSGLNRRDFLKLAMSFPLLGLRSNLSVDRKGLTSGTNSQINILIIVFDALSALHLPIYGYPRPTTPNLERFARRANVYHAHYAPANFTTPGTASLLSGLYPWTHRAFHLHGTVLPERVDQNLFHQAGSEFFRLGYSHNLLVTSLLFQDRRDLDSFEFSRELALLDLEYSDRLFPKDYNDSFWSESAILRGGSAKPTSLFLTQVYRLWQFFRQRHLETKYATQFPLGIGEDNQVFYIMENGVDWCIDQLGKMPRPYLAYLHFLPPHHPYLPRADFIGRFDDGFVPPVKPRHRFSEKENTEAVLNQKRQAYDEYLAYADSEFGRLYDQMDKAGTFKDTMVVFTSDHGEMFERGIWGHGNRTLFEPVIRIPLILSSPGQEQRQDIRIPTSNIDLLPTIQRVLGKEAPAWCEGRILPGIDDASSTPNSDRSLYAMELKQNAQRGLLDTGTFALFKEGYKLIHYQGYRDAQDTPDELYDLANDADELENLIGVNKSLAQELNIELNKKIDQVNKSIKGIYDP